jgi:hypothetical protein
MESLNIYYNLFWFTKELKVQKGIIIATPIATKK